METIAKRYAESLFDLASEENAILKYQNDMSKVFDVFQDDTFVQFFSHVSISENDKFSILKKSFSNQIDQYVLNFLFLLIKKRRIRYIREICKEFESLCNDHFGIKVGKVFSAFALSDDQISKVEQAISQKIGKEVKLHAVIDESLIGGIKVEIDNHIYDDSLSYKLESLRKELLRK